MEGQSIAIQLDFPAQLRKAHSGRLSELEFARYATLSGYYVPDTVPSVTQRTVNKGQQSLDAWSFLPHGEESQADNK